MNTLNSPHLLFTRRQLLISSVCGLTAIPLIHPAFISTAAALNDKHGERFLTSKNDASGRSYITALDAAGKIYFEIPVAHRCHATTFDPIQVQRAVIFPKRLGYVGNRRI